MILLFEVPCDVDFRFYGTVGSQATACSEDRDTVAVECDPEDRPKVIALFRKLLSLLESGRPTDPEPNK
ncbi:MAG TPA: hypothetical protein VE967_19520 [Gemmatimonadaceae bacterium]|nr:hypothetical protein [Gemmatimonadaceae bacterium]